MIGAWVPSGAITSADKSSAGSLSTEKNILPSAEGGYQIEFLMDDTDPLRDRFGRLIQSRLVPMQLLDSLEDHLGHGQLEVGHGNPAQQGFSASECREYSRSYAEFSCHGTA